MKQDELIDNIEKYNLHVNNKIIDLKSSKEYKIGKIIVKAFDFKNYGKNLKNHFVNKKIKKLSHANGFFYNTGTLIDSKQKVVVYTCITNGYDSLLEPLSTTCDYVAFCDEKSRTKRKTKWEQRPIEGTFDNGTLANRYIKMHPFELFPNYDFAIYVDGNVRVVGDPRKLCEIARKSKAGIAIHEHSERSCIYEEGVACTLLKKGNPEKIKQQLDAYRKNGMPENYGLLEATILVFDLRNNIAKTILQEWYQEFLKNSSGRDQLSFPYVLWKMKLSKHDLGILGNNVWRNPFFSIEYNMEKHSGQRRGSK